MIKEEIQKAINGFWTENLTDAAFALLKSIGLESPRRMSLHANTFDGFVEWFDQLPLENKARMSMFNEEKALKSEWHYIDFLFQITSEELEPGLIQNNFDENRSDSYLFFALELKNSAYSRTELSRITREINKLFMQPALIIFKTGEKITVSIIDRRPNKQDEKKDVLEKITLIKDIDIKKTHRAHVDILHELSLEELKKARYPLSNFLDLHNAWQKVLDLKELNKRFYKELSNWYFWAVQNVKFPADVEKDETIRNSTNLIRLITRVIFVWFIKEKDLVPNYLFDKNYLSGLLKDFCKNEDSKNYYKAILQNLFFATLNQKIDDRKFAQASHSKGVRSDYGSKNLYRYHELFENKTETEIKKLFETIPFLNGGLFDCLDKDGEDGKVKYIDGFSRNNSKVPVVPDFLFFGSEQNVDLNEIYGTSGRSYETKGLISILNSYKFTVTENTPLEEDVALDPELLGRVFENLLASYNPETKTTARKQTGSFYTPREIVDYMVTESLIAYLKTHFLTVNSFLPLGASQYDMFGNEMRTQAVIGQNENKWKGKEDELEQKIRAVLTEETETVFAKDNKKTLISALNKMKIFDPACGSGAFPMGILHKMVEILQKLDPDNKEWRELQEEKASADAKTAFKIEDQEERENRLKEISDIFENNASDYGRKLFLIENCIFGVDIQPIAIQISKLRFFLSLVIEQKTDKNKDNFGIRPLPNLETKFVAANALLALEKNNTLFKTGEIAEKENSLKQVRYEYFTASIREKKKQLQDKDEKLRKELSEMLRVVGFAEKSANSIAQFDPYDPNKAADWFDSEWMFGMENGFDIVIGNPPYIQLQKMGEIIDEYKKMNYEVFERTGDIYCLFYERGYQLLKPQGILCLITSKTWMKSGFGKSTRNFFAKKTNPELLIEFAHSKVKVFDATVNVNILMFSRDKNRQKTQACEVKEKAEKEISDYIRQNSINCSFKTSDSWVILSPIEQSIKSKIEAVGVPLKEWDIQINYGIKTGCNEAFIIDGAKKKELVEQDPKSDEIIRPILRGRDIKRYGYEFADLYVILAYFGSHKILEKQYPAIYNHLLQYKPQLEQRGQCRYTSNGKQKKNADYIGQHHWLELDNNPTLEKLEDFSRQKIIWLELVDSPNFALDETGIMINNTVYFITGNNIYFLIAYLNSSLCNWQFGNICATSGTGTRRWTKQYVEQICVPIPTEKQNQKMKNLIEKIEKANKKQLTSEIDDEIFALFNLSSEEMGFINSQ